MSSTLSPTGYQLILVDPAEGEHGHRAGSLESIKPAVGLRARDGYTLSLLLDPSDPRIGLTTKLERIPIVFRFDRDWEGEWLTYRVIAPQKIKFISEPWGDDDMGELPWGNPIGEFGIRLAGIPERLDTIGRAIELNWLWDRKQFTPEDQEYVNKTVFTVGEGFHHVGGAPWWVQTPERMKCPECREKMPFLLSLDSDGKTNWCFGDAGRLYVFYCEKCSVVAANAQGG